jgi:hypothetical protein
MSHPVSTTAILICAAARSTESGTPSTCAAVYSHSYGTPQYMSRTPGSVDSGWELTKRLTGRVPTVESATTTACSAGRLRSTFSPVRASSACSACGER